MSQENQNVVKIEFIELTDHQKKSLSKCNKCSLLNEDCQICAPFENHKEGYYILENKQHIFHEIKEDESKEFNKCAKYNCYYNQEGAPDCPNCYWFQRDDLKDGYFKEITK